MTAPQPPRLDAPLRRLLGVIVIGIFLSVLDMTVVNVAIDRLGVRLHSSVASTQWVITSYLLALAAAVPLTGWASRRFSARRAYLACLLVFTMGSALCGLAWSLGSLVAFRAIQGIGGGALFPIAQTIIAREAGPRRMARTLSIIGSVSVLAPVLGPIMGGFILDHFSWRWIFLVNLPIGMVGLVLAWLRLPADQAEATGGPDVVGLIAMGLGLPAFTYATAELGEGAPVASFRGGGLLVISLILIAFFIWHALRVKRPLLDLRLFANRTYATATAAMFMFSAAVFGPYLVMPLFFQQVQHASAEGAGALFAAQAIGAAASIRLGGILGHRVQAGVLASCGAVIMIAFTLVLPSFDQMTSHIEAVVVLVGRGFGIGLAMIPLIAAALSELERRQLPDGSAQSNVVQRIGSSLATTAIAVLLSNQLGSGTQASPAHVAMAYDRTLWAAVGLAVLVLPFALALLGCQRRTAARAAWELRRARTASDR